VEEVIDFGDRKKIIKRQYFFKPDNLPENYHNYIDPQILKDKKKKKDPLNYPCGCTSYTNFFSH